MKNIRLIALLVICTSLVGCTVKSKILGKDPSETTKNTTSFIAEATVKPTATPTATVMKPTPTVAQTVAPSPTPLLTQQPGKKITGEKLDFNALNALNNTSSGWWISTNKEHLPTTVTPQIKQLIDKYDGYYIGDSTKKIVYLTFDEGYENGYTPSILDTLKANNVKTIFFVTGPYIKDHSDLVKRMLDEGHLVGNHTISHLSMPTLDNQTLENEMLGLEKQFTAAFGKGMRYYRPPMGEYSERTLAAAKQLGYKTIFWSYAFLDYDINNQKGTEFAYNSVMNNLHSGALYLLHAVSKDNAAALDRIIKDIKAQGYEIKQLDF